MHYQLLAATTQLIGKIAITLHLLLPNHFQVGSARTSAVAKRLSAIRHCQCVALCLLSTVSIEIDTATSADRSVDRRRFGPPRRTDSEYAECRGVNVTRSSTPFLVHLGQSYIGSVSTGGNGDFGFLAKKLPAP